MHKIDNTIEAFATTRQWRQRILDLSKQTVTSTHQRNPPWVWERLYATCTISEGSHWKVKKEGEKFEENPIRRPHLLTCSSDGRMLTLLFFRSEEIQDGNTDTVINFRIWLRVPVLRRTPMHICLAKCLGILQMCASSKDAVNTLFFQGLMSWTRRQIQ